VGAGPKRTETDREKSLSKRTNMAHFSSKTKDFSKKYLVRRMARDGYKPQNTSERVLKIIFIFSPQNNVKSLSLSAKLFF